MLLPVDQMVFFKLLQGLGEHNIGDAVNTPLQFIVPQGAFICQMPQNRNFPFLPDETQCIHDGTDMIKIDGFGKRCNFRHSDPPLRVGQKKLRTTIFLLSNI